MYIHAKTATRTLGYPSIKKSNRHGAKELFSPSFVMAQPRLLAKEMARGAAEINSPVRRASSSRLKKNDR